MLNSYGILTKHVVNLAEDYNAYSAFADTPIYAPSTIEKYVDNESVKFIYIKRDIDEWFKSFNKHVTSSYNIHKMKGLPLTSMLHISLHDSFNGEKCDKDSYKYCYNYHFSQVISIVPRDRLLIYEFNQGHEPLSNFINKPELDFEIPHLNKNCIE